MSTTLRYASALLAVALTAVIALVAMPAQAAVTACDTGVGQRLPVVLVHGFTGNEGEWSKGGSASMRSELSRLANVRVETFDYSAVSRAWVDNEKIGPSLARRILCLSAASKRAGGSGKVVAVGHSMGGLALRRASAEKNISGKLGLVVTIGTPNIGSGWANIFSLACRSDKDEYCGALRGLGRFSQQIEGLPWLSGDTPVKAIAGDVSVIHDLFLAKVKQRTGGDLIVGKQSALRGAAHMELGGGQEVVSCSVNISQIDGAFDLGRRLITEQTPWPSCYHSNLPHNKQVEEATVAAIRKYQTSLSFGKYVGRWDVHGTVLRIKGDKAGELSWNAGACGESLPGVNCNGIARLRFAASGDGIRGTITAVRYQPWTTDPLPPDFTPPEGSYDVGQILAFRLIAPGVLRHLTATGNPYFCAEQASEEWHAKCNA